MSFRRTVRVLAEGRSDVSLHMKKWWTKHYNVDGQVTQHLSPFEQNVMTPMFKTAFQNTLKRIKNFVIEAGPGLSFGVAVYSWGEWKHGQLSMEHRD